MYMLQICMCIQYMYSMCAREYNVCVCGGDLYTGDFEVICGCCSCFFFFSQFIQQHLLTLFSICTTHTHTLTYVHTYYLSLHLLAFPSVAPQIPTHTKHTHTHTHDLVPVRAYGGMELPGIWRPILQVQISQQLPLLTAVQLYLQMFERREKERVIHNTYTTVCRKNLAVDSN